MHSRSSLLSAAELDLASAAVCTASAASGVYGPIGSGSGVSGRSLYDRAAKSSQSVEIIRHLLVLTVTGILRFFKNHTDRPV